jgi:hypothetical protein
MAGGSKSAMGHWKINCRSLQLVSKSAKPDVTFALWPDPKERVKIVSFFFFFLLFLFFIFK